MKTKLKPCPFCGEDNILLATVDSGQTASVVCQGCGARVIGDKVETEDLISPEEWDQDKQPWKSAADAGISEMIQLLLERSMT